MVELIFSPHWFYGKDIGIDVVSILALFLITWYSFRLYRAARDGRSALFTIGFFSLMLSFLFKILTNFELYYSTIQTQTVESIAFTYHVINVSNIPFFLGFLGYRALTFLGLALLFLVYYKNRTDRVSLLLYAYFLFVAMYFTQFSYYVFFLTNFLFLALITRHLWKHCVEKNNRNTLCLAASFTVITVSQLFFTFTGMFEVLYVFGELVQLIGYLLLLWTLILIERRARFGASSVGSSVRFVSSSHSKRGIVHHHGKKA